MSRGGKHKPIPHIVRIVVVPMKAVSSPRKGHGPHQHKELTAHQLETATKALKKIDAGEPTTQGAGSMFDVLEPTDIVVIGDQAASVRLVDKYGNPASLKSAKKAGRKAARLLFGHDDGHKDTVLRVWTGSDTIEYRCAVPFEIVEVQKAGWKIHGTADNPFADRKPYKARKEQGAEGGEPLWVWRSSPLRAAANNQQYKMTFKIGKELIDPDVVCGDPPPSP